MSRYYYRIHASKLTKLHYESYGQHKDASISFIINYYDEEMKMPSNCTIVLEEDTLETVIHLNSPQIFKLYSDLREALGDVFEE